VARYETLRGRAIGGETSGWRLGLAIVQRRGVAAWLRAAEAITVAAAPSRPTGEVPVADGDELVGVLASMALACLRGG
jgi:hypothetical protein